MTTTQRHRAAALTPRTPDIDLRSVADYLSDRCGFGSFKDSARIIERIISLVEAGEEAPSIMRRLNPPAITGIDWEAIREDLNR